jgi:uncharacterized damage-inducible protein DinB
VVALSGEELMAWVEKTSERWVGLVGAHPEALAFPCDVRETQTVMELLQHIVAVEMRYAQRLRGVAESEYEEFSLTSVEELYRKHDEAMAMLRDLLPKGEGFWEETIAFQTRSMGVLYASRRTVFVHTLMHSIRHYAQLATLVRQRGVTPDWAMDYLFMGATR